jgi:penicillin-binding protein 1A
MSDDGQNTVSAEELEKIKKDIAEAKDKLVGKELQEAIAKAKAEASEETKKQLEQEQKLKELEEARKKAEDELKKQQEEANKRLEMLQEKVDELSGSKNVATGDNPFKSPSNTDKPLSIDNMTEEQIQELQEQHMRHMLGSDYDRVVEKYR